MSNQDKLYAQLQEAMEPFAEALLEGTGLMPAVFEGLKLFGIGLIKLALFLDQIGVIDMTADQLMETTIALGKLENMAYTVQGEFSKDAKSRIKDQEAIARARERARAAQEETTESLKELNQELQNVPAGLKIILRAFQNTYAGGAQGDVLAGVGGTNLFVRNGIGTEAANKWNNAMGT